MFRVSPTMVTESRDPDVTSSQRHVRYFKEGWRKRTVAYLKSNRGNV